MYNYRGSREQLNRVSIPFENLFSLYRRISPTVTVPPFSSPLFAIARCANCLPTNQPETNVRVNVISSKLGAEGIGNYDARARELEREREGEDRRCLLDSTAVRDESGREFEFPT